jgi:hypothetical protein
MKNRILLAALLIVGTVFLRGDGCIMKDKPVDLVAYIELCEEYQQDEGSLDWSNDEDIEFDVEVDKEIKDAGYSRDDVKDAKFVVGHYGALKNTSAHDWKIGGTIKVQRLDESGPIVTAMTYTEQWVNAAIGKKIKADVNPAAVTIINDAVKAYLGGQNGVVLRFILDNDTAEGPAGELPSPTDRMTFDWKAWIELYIMVTEEFEWPDPF